jgi:hypothetical protein
MSVCNALDSIKSRTLDNNYCHFPSLTRRGSSSITWPAVLTKNSVASSTLAKFIKSCSRESPQTSEALRVTSTGLNLNNENPAFHWPVSW